MDSSIPEQFDYIRTISPVHNVQERVYPTALFLCASHDDRVVAAHTNKMVATLQHVNKDNPNPILMRVDLNAGHGAGKSVGKRIEEAADSECVRASGELMAMLTTTRTCRILGDQQGFGIGGARHG